MYQKNNKNLAGGGAPAAVETKPEDTAPICSICICICIGSSECQTEIITSCGHHFHLECLKPWCASSAACPLCRQELDTFIFACQFLALEGSNKLALGIFFEHVSSEEELTEIDLDVLHTTAFSYDTAVEISRRTKVLLRQSVLSLTQWIKGVSVLAHCLEFVPNSEYLSDIYLRAKCVLNGLGLDADRQGSFLRSMSACLKRTATCHYPDLRGEYLIAFMVLMQSRNHYTQGNALHFIGTCIDQNISLVAKDRADLYAKAVSLLTETENVGVKQSAMYFLSNCLDSGFRILDCAPIYATSGCSIGSR